MKWITLSIGFILAVVVASCREKIKNSEHFTPEVRQAASAELPKVPFTPTNPSGGDIPGKAQSLDPAESARRQAINTAKPIVWGTSIGGIAFDTNYNDARKILAQRLASNGGFEVYPEGIQIGWTGGEPRFPEIIIAFGNYGGRLSLPEPYGSGYLGKNLSSHFNSDPHGVDFMHKLGAHFEGRNPANYDCRAELTCSRSAFNGLIFYDFKKGSIGIDPRSHLNLVYFVNNQNFFPRVSGDVIYGESVGSINFASLRSASEQVIGPPQGQNGNLLFYDDLHLLISWSNNSPQALPTLIAVQGDFRGNIVISEEPSEISRKIGDSFADLAADEDLAAGIDEDYNSIQTLLIILDRLLNEDEDRECLKNEVEGEPTPLCAIETQGDSVFLKLQRGTFVFSNNAQLNLELVSLVAEPVDFTD